MLWITCGRTHAERTGGPPKPANVRTFSGAGRLWITSGRALTPETRRIWCARVQRRRIATFGLLPLALLFASRAFPESPGPRPQTADAEQIVFLLQYVGSDYAAAVRGGRIIDEAE